MADRFFFCNSLLSCLLLSKLLPLLVLPPGICVLLALVGLLLRRTWLIWLSVGLLWLLSMPVVGDALLLQIEKPYRPVPMQRVKSADAIVVLSGMLTQIDGLPLGEWGDAADRFDGGIALYKAAKAPLLVFTGGHLPWQPESIPEGELLARRARLRGVPAASILLTSHAANTAQEAVAAATLLGVKSDSPKRILLVTSAFHMQRAADMFRAAGFEVEPYPVDFRETGVKSRTTIIDFFPSANGLENSALALREMIGRQVYRNGRFLPSAFGSDHVSLPEAFVALLLHWACPDSRGMKVEWG
ncbi:MAG TPA: YdcF family protein [Chlorobaculum parvum]|uniref:YdcF family protein n=1 Tax=Chlorobaculum parvum TaxID=274539 RepID=A0A7C5DJM1_9CHLB|nr:YdcF family protein [Chlorobaculum parvum]